ncbi:hypothetical protein M427DRAFT_275635 [Gonapodya prolifera JEL478]|uniref:Uncharacterized protein n=1 Tax=Gonapodya prolifera (strain JEL478) TaxID=1344416 RepID=A0A139AY28_GONPJ|nr:hypothetical protein M427DRAFT_275635 [Gonapodya prolifera JEL478]|eukprot:KXS21646.1 hypothetical protein M427DRAFT_275635 [Gonapodya prolifera JEL478]
MVPPVRVVDSIYRVQFNRFRIKLYCFVVLLFRHSLVPLALFQVCTLTIFLGRLMWLCHNGFRRSRFLQGRNGFGCNRSLSNLSFRDWGRGFRGLNSPQTETRSGKVSSAENIAFQSGPAWKPRF